jgi:ribosomal protein S18 acetylase RimI-like enzyme
MPPPIEAAASFGIAYRPMTDADLPFIARLYASTRTREMAATGWPAETRAAFLDQQHRAQHAHYRSVYPGAEWLVVERAGAPVGRLYLDEGAEDLHLIDVSLLPEARGAGLGGAILADLLGQARALGKSVSLHAESSNRARALYLRLGFAVEPGEGLYERMVWRP